jgi:hypothetical protein
MYRFCIENRSQALELVSGLQNEKKPLGRLYFGYLIFLATELDQEAASALLESYNGLDSLTGPYLAGILCIDKINAKLKGRLEGIDKTDKERIESLTPSHLAYLAQKGNCTHIDLDPPQWQLRSITRSTDHVARAIAKRRNLTSIRHSILHQAGTIAGEIAKPSFWLKIAKFLQ